MSLRIDTDRLVLRDFMPQDASVIVSLVGDMDVTRWLTRVPYPYALSDAEAFIKGAAKSQGTICAVTTGDQVIGCVSIVEELGYWLGKPFWGKGFATEAARALVTRHFATSGEGLRSGYVLGNAGSQRVLEKLGFHLGALETAPSASLCTTVEVQKMHLAAADWQALQ